jgi:pantoate--beta-alanine ligase
VPTVEEMYPAGRVVTVTPGDAAARWEGAARPGHFAGVLTVVAKLCHIVQPDVAVFGQKDAQQVMLIRAMVGDLDFPIEILIAPTVRESDGVAMSSRNAYLSPDERRQARVLSAALHAMHGAWHVHGVRDAAALETIGRGVIQTEPGVAVEYLGVAEPRALAPAATAEPGHLAMIAARVGRTRLIDNVVFTR